MEHVGFHFLTTIYSKLQLSECYPEEQLGHASGGGHNNDTNVSPLPIPQYQIICRHHIFSHYYPSYTPLFLVFSSTTSHHVSRIVPPFTHHLSRIIPGASLTHFAYVRHWDHEEH